MTTVESPVFNEMLLLQTTVECGILAPKSKWKSVVDRVDSYIEKLESEIAEMKKLEGMKKLDTFEEGGGKI
jgi:hypothetical protein